MDNSTGYEEDYTNVKSHPCISWWHGLNHNIRNEYIETLYSLLNVYPYKSTTDMSDKLMVDKLSTILSMNEGIWQRKYLDLQSIRESEKNNINIAEKEICIALRICQEENISLKNKLCINEKKENLNKIMQASSFHKGQHYELYMGKIIESTFPCAVYTNTSSIPHSGDAILFDPEYGTHKCLLEYKAHDTVIREHEIVKMYNDLDASKASYGIMCTRNVNVTGRKDFSIDRSPMGKPILFIIRTSGWGEYGISPVLRLALRILTHIVDNKTIGDDINYDRNIIANKYMRTYRKIKASLTSFDKQWNLTKKNLIESLDDIHIIIIPSLSIQNMKKILISFEDSVRPIPIERIHTIVRHSFPTTNRSELLRILRKIDFCKVINIKAGDSRWIELRRSACDKRKNAYFVIFPNYIQIDI